MRSDDVDFLGADVHEEGSFSEFVDEIEDFLGVTLDVVEVGLAMDEFGER